MPRTVDQWGEQRDMDPSLAPVASCSECARDVPYAHRVGLGLDYGRLAATVTPSAGKPKVQCEQGFAANAPARSRTWIYRLGGRLDLAHEKP